MTGAGREITPGRGEVTTDRDGVMLSLGSTAAPATSGPRLPFRGGVVTAALVEIPVDVPAGRAGGPGLIDGIPDEVRLLSVPTSGPARKTAREASEAARQASSPDRPAHGRRCDRPDRRDP